MKKLDLTKPVQTRDGRAARIVSTNLRGPCYTIGALVTDENGKEDFQAYTLDGAFGAGAEIPNDWDLVNVPEKKVWERWFNIYPNGSGAAHASYNEAQTWLGGGGTIIHVKHEYIEGEHQQ